MAADTADDLYALPLEEFTRARNELASKLLKSGDKQEAARVKSLPKPTVSAWAVNQLARRDEVGVRALLRAVEQLRAAASGDALRDAMREQREAVRRLVRSAELALEEAGHSPSPAVVDRISRTLQAVATDEDGRELVRTGRLARDLDPTGFGVSESLAAAAPAAPRAKRAARTREPEPRPDPRRAQRLERAQARLDEARSDLDEREQETRAAREEAAALRRQADRAERDLAKAEERAERARERVAKLEEEVARL